MSNSMINQQQLLGAIDKILVKASIARRVSDNQPLLGPTGLVTGAYRDKENDKLKIMKAEVEAISRKIKTEYTYESLTDLQRTYGESFYDVLATQLVDDIAYKIDEDFIKMINERAPLVKSVDFDDDEDLETAAFMVVTLLIKGLSDLPISDNRSPKGWAIINSDLAALLVGPLSGNITTDESNKDTSASYLGKIGGVDIYIDYTSPNEGKGVMTYGIKGNGITRGSTIYSHYNTTWYEAVDSDTGEPMLFILDRTALTINPLDEEYYQDGDGESAFLGKMEFDISDMKAFS